MHRLTQARFIYGVVVALYVLIFPWHPGLRSPNELCRLWQSRSIVDDGTLSINRVIERDGMVGDLSVKDGVLYPSKAPLMSFLGVPIYWVLKKVAGEQRLPQVPQVFWSRLFLTVLPTLVMLIFLRRFLMACLEPPVAEALTVTYALGSLAFSYSEAFFSHQATAVLLFGAFYWAWRTLRGERPTWGWAVAGAFAGAAVLAEYTGALTVLCLAVYAAVALWRSEGSQPQRTRRIAMAAALVLVGSAPFLGSLMAYHQACFGHPLTSGYKYLNDPGYQGWHVGGFLGIKLPDPKAFVLSFFSPLRGLFMLSPFLLLGVVGLKDLWAKDRALFWFGVTLLLANAYFTSSFAYESWGWTTGPRHMTPLVPHLLLPAGLLLARLRRGATVDEQVGYGIGIGACVVSVLTMGAITFVNYVPDSLSTSLFGLAVPLFQNGFWPPTVLNFVGLSNPAAAGVVFALLGAAALSVAGVLWAGSPMSRAVRAAAAAVVVGHLLLLSGATRHDEADRGAVGHLQSVWLAPKGTAVPFWQ